MLHLCQRTLKKFKNILHVLHGALSCCYSGRNGEGCHVSPSFTSFTHLGKRFVYSTHTRERYAL